MHPKPLNVAEVKLFFFLLLLMFVGRLSLALLLLLVVEKVESSREEMVDLQRVDWIIDGICCGFGSDSEMGCMNWLLGLLNLMCSATVEVSGMISR